MRGVRQYASGGFRAVAGGWLVARLVGGALCWFVFLPLVLLGLLRVVAVVVCLVVLALVWLVLRVGSCFLRSLFGPLFALCFSGLRLSLAGLAWLVLFGALGSCVSWLPWLRVPVRPAVFFYRRLFLQNKQEGGIQLPAFFGGETTIDLISANMPAKIYFFSNQSFFPRESLL
jgi:hypothetical protein